MDFLDLYYYSHTFDDKDSADFDTAKRKAFALVLPKIIESDLTQMQRICIQMKYVNNLSQCEIAKKLGITQPSVSRHIASGKRIINDKLKYCYIALTKALYEYEKSYA